ncbi:MULTISPECIES: hypothetical protein [unclassified Endozoicomonas]|uniref:hypothetical protein n=1 Tax=unclassified Endozoicomonas TaxID=2644528 RepID=UPI00214825AC|nr:MULTISPECIES: hypothetical protein [unclassified Endozoicomonas]
MPHHKYSRFFRFAHLTPPLSARLNRRDLTCEFWRYTSGRSADHYENGHGQVLRLKDKTTLRLDVRSRSNLDVELKPEGE